MEAFLLRDGGIYTAAFWIGQIAVGTLLPLAIVILASGRNAWLGLAVAAVLFLLGGVAQMYVTIIGGQAFPLRLFPGMEVSKLRSSTAKFTNIGLRCPSFCLG